MLKNTDGALEVYQCFYMESDLLFLCKLGRESIQCFGIVHLYVYYYVSCYDDNVVSVFSFIRLTISHIINIFSSK